MTLNDRVTVSPEVMVRQVGDELVILELAKGTYFGLDPVGTRIWQLIEKGGTLSEIGAVLFEEYDVPREVLEGDLVRVVGELLAEGLVLAEAGN
jgi:hypothetical protein